VTRRSSEALLRELAADLRPVRPIPRLRSIVAAIALLAFAGAATLLWRKGLRPDLVPVVSGDAIYDAVGVGMVAIGSGALVAGVAACVPGRERTQSRALRWAALGAALAFLVVPLGVVAAQRHVLRPPEVADLACVVSGLAVSVLAAAASLVFGWRTAPRSLALAAAFAAAGAGAVGAIAVHAVCPSPKASHWLWGHACVPVVAGLLAFGTGSALVALRARPLRRRRRSPSS
jgi:hypothetical protein